MAPSDLDTVLAPWRRHLTPQRVEAYITALWSGVVPGHRPHPRERMIHEPDELDRFLASIPPSG